MTSRQSRSSLGYIADATTNRLLDGSIIVNASTLTATNLQPSTTLKTDESRNIVTADLFLSDIKDYVPPPEGGVFNPLTENLNADGKDIINVGNLSTTLINNRNILYNASISNLNMANFNINNVDNLNTTTINNLTPAYNTPLIDLDMNNKNIENVGNLETTLINSRGILYNTSIANLNMGGFNINNSPTITTLQGKTAFITTNPEFNETVFNGPVLLNGTVSNANEILFNNGSSISSNTQDLTLYSQFNIATDSNFNSTAQITCNTLNADNISVPAITTLQTKTQNLTASTGQATFSGILNVNSELKVNSLSTLVGGILSNQKITLTKNIIEIQEDGVYSQAITIGNLATTGYALPRTTNSIAGSDLRLLSDGNLSFHAPGSIRAYRVDTVPDFNTLTFASANVFVNFSGYLTTQQITNNAFTWQATGARYEGTVTRNFIADFSVILLNENKDIVPNITLTLVNITGAIDYSSQIVEHTHNRSRQWCLSATGTVAQNQIISARIRSSLALASTTIGSPQLNITLL